MHYNELALVYALSPTENEDIRNTLPFFIKANLIIRSGIKVTLYKITILAFELI